MSPPDYSTTIFGNQSVEASFVMMDANGNGTDNIGTYSYEWTVDDPGILRFHVGSPNANIPIGPDQCLAGPVNPNMTGSANLILTMRSSDPANHPDLVKTLNITIVGGGDEVVDVRLSWGFTNQPW